MRRTREAVQTVDRSDPTVQAFMRDCGLAQNAVTIKLTGASEEDLRLQIDRLQKALGSLLVMAQPRLGQYNEWIAMGTILG